MKFEGLFEPSELLDLRTSPDFHRGLEEHQAL